MAFGPYRMTSYVAGEQMVLEANPNFYGDDKPIIPKVIIRYFADPTTMSQAVEKARSMLPGAFSARLKPLVCKVLRIDCYQDRCPHSALYGV